MMTTMNITHNGDYDCFNDDYNDADRIDDTSDYDDCDYDDDDDNDDDHDHDHDHDNVNDRILVAKVIMMTTASRCKE